MEHNIKSKMISFGTWELWEKLANVENNLPERDDL
jgi:hypothetical protein